MINANRDWVYYSYTRVEGPSVVSGKSTVPKSRLRDYIGDLPVALLNQTKKDSGSAR